LHCLLAYNWSKEGAPGNALGLFKTTIESNTGAAASGTYLGSDGEDGVKAEWAALFEALIGIIGWVEEGDKEMTSREEYVVETPCLTIWNQAFLDNMWE
jgi:hypothetical protein